MQAFKPQVIPWRMAPTGSRSWSFKQSLRFPRKTIRTTFENLKFDNNNNYSQSNLEEGSSQAGKDVQGAKCE